jgi:transposase InsO family protein
MQISMSRTGYDNAHMESFFKTVKYEEVHLSNYKPTTMSSSAFLISSRRCITAKDCIALG